MKNVIVARFKLLSLIIFSTVIIFVKDFRILTFLLFALLTSVAIFRLKTRLFPRLTSLFSISLLIILFNLIFNTAVSPVSRILLGSMAATRILILSIMVFLYTSFTSPAEIIFALSFLPKSIQLMLTITLSLIPLIASESQKIMLVQSTRGYHSRSFNPVKNIIPIIIPLIHRTLNRAERIATVLETRGFHET